MKKTVFLLFIFSTTIFSALSQRNLQSDSDLQIRENIRQILEKQFSYFQYWKPFNPGSSKRQSPTKQIEEEDPIQEEEFFDNQMRSKEQRNKKCRGADKIGSHCVCENLKVYRNGKCVESADFLDAHFQDLLAIGKINRSIDGKGNNVRNIEWGSSGTMMSRKAQANYAVGGSVMVSGTNPRVISNSVGNLEGRIPFNKNGFTAALTFWGQFLDHDLDLIAESRAETADIVIPKDDSFFKNQTTIPFSRSKFEKSNSEPRQFRNEITSWIDGSQIYGSSQNVAKLLRSFKNGKLRTSGSNLLPLQDNFFISGDERVNENVILTSYHTIFFKEHNRICDQITNKKSNLSDEEVYQIARHYIIGLLQKITFEQFLPKLLGPRAFKNIVGKYKKYDKNIDPSIPIQFATAAYRVGHSLLIPNYRLIDQSNKVVQRLKLKDLFFSPKKVNNVFLETLFRGLARTLLKTKTNEVISDVRNFLVQGQGNIDTLVDLFSLNVQRSRDHGIQYYNEVRKTYGLRQIRSFTEFFNGDWQKIRKFIQVYRDIDEMELWVGIISEEPNPEGIMGELGSLIVGSTFRNLRDGDRFWYESAYPKKVIDSIKETSFGQIIRRNIANNSRIPEDIFVQ